MRPANKKSLTALVESVNEQTGLRLSLDYKACYGGYTLFDDAEAYDKLHFFAKHGRISAREMQAYLYGLLDFHYTKSQQL